MSKPSEHETYIGDGVYASFDGNTIKLKTERDGGYFHIIYLEPQVFADLEAFARKCWSTTGGADATPNN